MMDNSGGIIDELKERFGSTVIGEQLTRDVIPTVWVKSEEVHSVLKYLKSETTGPYRMLYDLTAIDERLRSHREDQPEGDFSVVYHLLSFDRNADIRVKTPLQGEEPSLATITGLWSSADWYEREVWDMFGIGFEGRTGLRRILLPPGWEGHPLRKEYPARATEMEPFRLPPERQEEAQEALRFHPEEWGLTSRGEDTDLMFLNLGPQHPGAHGVFRILLQLDGEEIVQAVPEIGFHHRGAENNRARA